MTNKNFDEENNDLALWLLIFLFFPLDEYENEESEHEEND